MGACGGQGTASRDAATWTTEDLKIVLEMPRVLRDHIEVRRRRAVSSNGTVQNYWKHRVYKYIQPYTSKNFGGIIPMSKDENRADSDADSGAEGSGSLSYFISLTN